MADSKEDQVSCSITIRGYQLLSSTRGIPILIYGARYRGDVLPSIKNSLAPRPRNDQNSV